MHRPHTPKFTAWQAAECEAQAAERALFEAMLGDAGNPSHQPQREQVDAARAARARARALFEEAMQEMAVLAQSLHHRRIGRVVRGEQAPPPATTDGAGPPA